MQKDAKTGKPKVGMNFLLIGSGQMFTSMVIAGFIVGYAFDYYFETTPIFMMLCGLLGLIGGTQKVHRLLMRLEQPAKQTKDAANE